MRSAVYGSRFLANDAARRRGPAGWSLGNRLVTQSFNLLFNQRLTDLYTGLRAVRRTALATVTLGSPGFEIVLEIAAALARNGARIAEVPIGYAPRRSGQSKMRHAREAV